MKYDIIKGRRICFWCDKEIKPREALLHDTCHLRFKKTSNKVNISNYIEKRRAKVIAGCQKEMQYLHTHPEGFTDKYIQGRLQVISRFLYENSTRICTPQTS